MLTERRPASPLLVRVAAASLASVLLGVLAHASTAGVLPGPGALCVIVLLVLMVIGGLLAGAQAAGRWTRRRVGPVPVEDAAGVLALVVGQALVHWLVLPVGVPAAGTGSVLSSGHLHAGALPADRGLSHHAAATGPGMLLVHAVAAVMVAVALRWVEAELLGLIQVLRLVRAPMAACLGALRPGIRLTAVVPHRQRGTRVGPWWSADARPRLRVTLLPLERRGPPAVDWNQHVVTT